MNNISFPNGNRSDGCVQKFENPRSIANITYYAF